MIPQEGPPMASPLLLGLDDARRQQAEHDRARALAKAGWPIAAARLLGVQHPTMPKIGGIGRLWLDRTR
jgi:hypothetical protein